ncbi:PhzF family phenazine biosynthesis protein [Hyphomicrobium sp.]|jgi:trans-2,3-dihydro-3-hydroxyanthranilate isomerase|uniref:PhzF family phenazine biosynthesis protein n=1 Tax=Hyphomicrobium sp. TaxID=82 RepID=UPI002CED48BD|nr:PhzF family phenazine biosynthesis protein [Hyphomicrobium sp.]HVZ05459.1 PhzF family phenazine biosynthesis protein [Hyphomicrobium sp.]
MALTYHILDVFTERPFGGNPLAVVLDADPLSSADMQKVAREFNLSETVFVLTPTSAGHTARIRIFTPSRELAFAGHPTLGTAALLAELRTQPQLNGERDAIIALEEEIGSIRVGVRLRSQAAAYGEFDAPKAENTLERLSEPEEISAAVGLIPTEIGFENHKPTLLRGSNTFAFMPVSNLEAMSKVKVAPLHWSRAFTARGVHGVYLYTRQSVRVQSAFHARMFAPDLGVPEDPATGSAAAGFAYVINEFDELPDGTHKRAIEQGIEMGRPSAITLTMMMARNKLETVRIGGHAVRIAEGTLRF